MSFLELPVLLVFVVCFLILLCIIRSHPSTVFTDDIARKGVRPSLEGVPEELQILVKECWDKKQDVRPTFEELITRIRKLRVDMNLPASLCPNGILQSSSTFILTSL